MVLKVLQTPDQEQFGPKLLKSDSVTDNNNEQFGPFRSNDPKTVKKMALLPTWNELGREVERGFNITKDKVMIPLGVSAAWAMGKITGEDFENNESFNQQVTDAYNESQNQINAPSQTIGGRMARDTSRLVTAFPIFMVGARAAGLSAPAAAWSSGLFSDLFAFDNNEQRLSNSIADFEDEHKDIPILPDQTIGWVAKQLAADPHDSKLVGKLKQGAEGIIMGEILDRTVVKPVSVGLDALKKEVLPLTTEPPELFVTWLMVFVLLKQNRVQKLLVNLLKPRQCLVLGLVVLLVNKLH